MKSRIIAQEWAAFGEVKHLQKTQTQLSFTEIKIFNEGPKMLSSAQKNDAEKGWTTFPVEQHPKLLSR